MNKMILPFLLLWMVILSPSLAQSSLEGSWKLISENGKPLAGSEMVAIYSDDYFMFGHYGQDGHFIKAGGGTYALQNKQYQQQYDFYTQDSSRVRKPEHYAMEQKGNQMVLKNKQGNATQTWERLESTETPLTGAWRFAARVDEEGNAGERRKPGPRQTLKILSGDRFQWAAFNYETKEFSGTGGGTYTASEGKYTESIEFFSRDDQRVGQSLQFQFEREGNDWFHQGKSSKGEPLHEIWEKL